MGLDELRKLKEDAENRPIPKNAIRKVSDKRAAKLSEQIKMAELDEAFYKKLWSERPHKCVECGKSLGNTFKKWFFHHLLPKSKYPQFRHDPLNIVFADLECHSKAETNIDFAPKIKELTNQFKIKNNL
jgi:hypothetical protein